MIGVGLLFIFVAGIAFLGFIIGALFNKIKITKVLPLMLLGLLVGPILNLVNTSPGSTIANLVPVVSALAISFILFDVGLNINIFRLSKVMARATAFTFSLAIATGIVISIAAYFVFGWNIFESLIFGFALSGPSSAVVPTLLRSLKIKSELNDTLLYESVITDSLQLVVPILLLQFMLTSNLTVTYALSAFIGSVFGALALGAFLAILWLYILKTFGDYSKNYGWMLTVTMVLATYGIADQLGVSTAIAIFTFGLVFSNLGMITLKVERPSEVTKTPMLRSVVNIFIMQYLHLGNKIHSIKDYQKEIEFFTSTFFFVYIGLLFTLNGLTILMVSIAIIVVLLMVLLRYIFMPLLHTYMSKDASDNRTMSKLISFNVARGLSPSIVATLPLAAGIIIPGFLNEMFLVVLFSNIATTLGIFAFYKPAKVVQTTARKAAASVSA